MRRRGIRWTPPSFSQERASFVRRHKKSPSLKQATFIGTTRRIYRRSQMLLLFRGMQENVWGGGDLISRGLIIKALRSSGWYQSWQHRAVPEPSWHRPYLGCLAASLQLIIANLRWTNKWETMSPCEGGQMNNNTKIYNWFNFRRPSPSKPFLILRVIV